MCAAADEAGAIVTAAAASIARQVRAGSVQSQSTLVCTSQETSSPPRQRRPSGPCSLLAEAPGEADDDDEQRERPAHAQFRQYLQLEAVRLAHRLGRFP